jgi:hypothetical protein
LTCVRAKGNAVCDACRLRWEMNIFKRILTGIAEDVVDVSDENHVCESATEAAIRETLEETGYQICVPKNVAIISRYDFEWEGRIFDCETTFFIGQLLSRQQQPVEDAAYHRGVEWLPLDSVNAALSYHKVILQSVLDLISLNRFGSLHAPNEV